MIPAKLLATYHSVSSLSGLDATTAVNMTVSGGNLVATSTAANPAAADGTGVSKQLAGGKSSGKWYFEVTFTNQETSTGTYGCGVMETSADYTDLTNNALAGALKFSGSASNNFWVNGTKQVNAAFGSASGNVMALAVDLDNHLVYAMNITHGEAWNNNGSANPATQTGGFTIPSAAPWVPVVVGGLSGASFTCNFAGAFVGTVPAGFSAWG